MKCLPGVPNLPMRFGVEMNPQTCTNKPLHSRDISLFRTESRSKLGGQGRNRKQRELQSKEKQEMSAQYGGDEISALVLDSGSHSTRAGYAGEDTPKAHLPTSISYLPAPVPSSPLLPQSSASSTNTPSNKTVKRYFSDSSIHVPRPFAEITNPWDLNEGIVRDFDEIGALYEYIFSSHLRVQTSDHPLLMTEPAWTPPSHRLKALECAFEKLCVPASYLLKGAVGAAFAGGKASALVIDLGHAMASVTPVYDGFVLKRGLQKQSFAGAALDGQLEMILRQGGTEITPHYSVTRRARGDIPASLVQRPDLSRSFVDFEKRRVVEELKECVLQCYEGQFHEDTANARPPRSFEFPDGSIISFRADRFRVPESLFQTVSSSNDPHSGSLNPLNPTSQGQNQGGSGGGAGSGGGGHISIGGMVQAALSTTDLDIRSLLLQNVVLTGGTSLIPNLESRISAELANLYPGQRVRVYASGNTVERKCAGWLGGSILGSLGTFHQLWISKGEYEEQGADRVGLIEKRCK